jgi:virginiamycin B lyase
VQDRKAIAKDDAMTQRQRGASLLAPISMMLIGCVLLAACDLNPLQSSSHTTVEPTTIPTGTTTTFQLLGGEISYVTTGPDGAIWFTETGSNKIGRMITNGDYKEFTLPSFDERAKIVANKSGLWFSEPLEHQIGLMTPDGTYTAIPFSRTAIDMPTDLVAGADGNLWFTENSERLIRVAPTGDVAVFALKDKVNRFPLVPRRLAAAPDGSIWFTYDEDQLGRLDAQGNVSTLPLRLNGHMFVNKPVFGMTVGADGNVWLAQGPTITRARPNGAMTEFSLPAGVVATGDLLPGPGGALFFIARVSGIASTSSASLQLGQITPNGAISRAPLSALADPYGMTSGPDGAFWFASSNKIGRITSTGMVTTFPVAIGASHPVSLAAGPDNSLWFAEDVDSIGQLSGRGAFIHYQLPAGAYPANIVKGPDNALWFAELGVNKIGRITPTYDYKEFAIPTAQAELTDIVAGPDGAIWFIESAARKIGRMTLKGQVQEFPAPANTYPSSLTAGPDGAVWFTAADLTTFQRKIERISSDGAIKELPLTTPDVSVGGLFPGPDGHLWLTDRTEKQTDSGIEIETKMGMVASSGAVTEFPVPFTNAPQHSQHNFSAITSGPDGNIWFVEDDGVVGRMTPTGEVTESDLLRKNFLPNYYYNAIIAGPGHAISILAVNRIIRVVV